MHLCNSNEYSSLMASLIVLGSVFVSSPPFNVPRLLTTVRGWGVSFSKIKYSNILVIMIVCVRKGNTFSHFFLLFKCGKGIGFFARDVDKLQWFSYFIS